MKKLLLFLVLPLFCFGFERFKLDESELEKGIECFLTVDPFHPNQKSKADFHSYIMMPVGSSFMVFSPRIGTYLDGSLDLSVGVGSRHQIGENVFGYHAFWDYSVSGSLSLHQVSPSIEYITPDFDVRVNYYHPLDSYKLKNGMVYFPQRWMETEAIFKTPYFHIGGGPVYNLSSKIFGAKVKISVPFQYFTVSSTAYLSSNSDKNYSCVSVGIPLYSSKNQPINRSSSVKHHVLGMSSFSEPQEVAQEDVVDSVKDIQAEEGIFTQLPDIASRKSEWYKWDGHTWLRYENPTWQ